LVIGASSGGGGGSPVDPTTILTTGDIKAVYGTGNVTGFVRLNGRTIGSATSGATERANSDVQALFQYLWGIDANLAVSGGRGVSAAADWAANKTIALPDWRGYAIAGLDDMGNSAAGRLTATYWGATGGCSTTLATVLGAACGAESQALSLAQLPTGITASGSVSTTSTVSNIGQGASSLVDLGSNAGTGSAGFGRAFSGSVASLGTVTSTGTASVTSNNTSGSAHPIVQPTILITYYAKL